MPESDVTLYAKFKKQIQSNLENNNLVNNEKSINNNSKRSIRFRKDDKSNVKNPDTHDGVVLYLVLLIISILGLISSFTYQLKNN